jgi:hypothetical protein
MGHKTTSDVSARTLLIHGIHMWPQMIDMMFWPFAFKAAAEQHNLLSLSSNRQTPLLVLHNVPVDTILVKCVAHYFAPCTCSTHACKVLVARDHQNGSLGVA